MPLGDNRRPFLKLGAFTFDQGDERLWGPGGPVRLGNKAYLVLSRLIEAEGRLVTKFSDPSLMIVPITVGVRLTG